MEAQSAGCYTEDTCSRGLLEGTSEGPEVDDIEVGNFEVGGLRTSTASRATVGGMTPG